MLLRELLGTRLRELRTGKGMSIRALAAAARVSPAHISEIERGRAEVSSELLAAICGGLGVDVADLLVSLIGMEDHDLRSRTEVHLPPSDLPPAPPPTPWAGPPVALLRRGR